MERVKYGIWVICMDSSKNAEGKVQSEWVLFRGKTYRKEGMGKIVMMSDREIKRVREALAD